MDIYQKEAQITNAFIHLLFLWEVPEITYFSERDRGQNTREQQNSIKRQKHRDLRRDEG